MLLRDQIVIQVGEELDGMVMIRSGDNRQGVCPLKFLQEVWHSSEVAVQVKNCPCFESATNISTNTADSSTNSTSPLTKLYYPVADTYRKNNEVQNIRRKSIRSINSSNILQYYYNNINNNDFVAGASNSDYFSKDSNINVNNIFAMSNNQKVILEKNHLSSIKRPLSITRNPSNFFMRTFRSDSQKRPLLLNYHSSRNENNHGPNFKIIPDKTGLKFSPIYSISENVEKYNSSRKFRQNSAYFGSYPRGSDNRPLYVRK